MTLNSKLTQMLKNNDLFGGVYMYNQLPTLHVEKIQNKFIIINMVTIQEADMNISGHFVALDNTTRQKGTSGKRYAFYFDPYGTYHRQGNKVPFDPDYARYLMNLPYMHNIRDLIYRLDTDFLDNNQMSKKFDYNHTQFQLFKHGDDICGVFCYIFVLQPYYKENQFLKNGGKNPTLLKMNQNLSEFGLKIDLLQKLSEITEFIDS